MHIPFICEPPKATTDSCGGSAFIALYRVLAFIHTPSSLPRVLLYEVHHLTRRTGLPHSLLVAGKSELAVSSLSNAQKENKTHLTALFGDHQQQWP